MIYLEETLNLMPASPETLDTLVGLAQERLIPLCKRLIPVYTPLPYSELH